MKKPTIDTRDYAPLPPMPWHIAIAEDAPADKKIVETAVNEEGFKIVAVCNNGQDLINICLTAPRIDLVITDILMPPGINGYEAASTILETTLLPVLFISGCSDKQAIEEFRALRRKTPLPTSTAYVVKPLNIGQIKVSIYTLMEDFCEAREDHERKAGRRRIEIAQALVMDEEHLSATESRKFLEKLASRKQKKLAVVAEEVIARAEEGRQRAEVLKQIKKT